MRLIFYMRCKIIIVLLFFSLLLSAQTIKGKDGAIDWDFITNDSTLVVKGTGPMNDYEWSYLDVFPSYPWVCYPIKKIIIKTGVTYIGNLSFINLEGLKDVSIPNTVKCIGNSSFHLCTSLDSIHIPNGVTDIKSRAFCRCENLKYVYISSTVRCIADNSFEECNNIERIDVAQDNEYFKVVDERLYDINKKKFMTNVCKNMKKNGISTK